MPNFLTVNAITNTYRQYPELGVLDQNVLFYPEQGYNRAADLGVTIRPGIRGTMVMAAGRKPKRGLTRVANCNPDYDGIGNIVDEFEITTYQVGTHQQQCVDVFLENIFNNAPALGIDISDLSKNNGSKIIYKLLQDYSARMVSNDTETLIWWGDRDSSVDLLNGTNGLFKTMQERGVTPVGVPTNPDGGDIYALFKAAFLDASTELKAVPVANKVFLVDGATYDKLLFYYVEESLGGGGFTAYTENGVSELRFQGIRIVAMRQWTDDFNALFNVSGGPGDVTETRLIYTVASNMVVGFDTTSTSQQNKWWYSEDKDSMLYRAKFYLGTSLAQPELTYAAFDDTI